MRHYPKHIGDTMQMMFREMGIERKVNQYKILDLWPEIVGENIALVTQAERVNESVLYVKVKSMSWRTELLFQKSNILKKIEDKIGSNIIRDLRFY